MSTFALPLVVTGVTDFFPTVDPREQPFVIADLEEFVAYSNQHGRRIFGGASELWVDQDSPPGDLTGAVAEAEAVGKLIQNTSITSSRKIVAEEEIELRV